MLSAITIDIQTPHLHTQLAATLNYSVQLLYNKYTLCKSIYPNIA